MLAWHDGSVASFFYTISTISWYFEPSLNRALVQSTRSVNKDMIASFFKLSVISLRHNDIFPVLIM